MNSIPSILQDLRAWDAAGPASRLGAARAVSAALPEGFAFGGMAVYALGGQSHEVGAFVFEGARFLLLPGHPDAVLGYDRARPFVPTPEQAADWAQTEGEYGVKLQRALDESLGPLRRVRLAPLLIEAEARPFVYSQDGDDQAEGYARATAACGPLFRLPTADEWEYACAAGTRSLFRWGDHTPDSSSYDERTWDLHRRPNAFGLSLPASTYDLEICAGPKFRGGDGGGTVCGGMGILASWLPLASAWENSDEEVDGWRIDEVRLRRVRPVGADGATSR